MQGIETGTPDPTEPAVRPGPIAAQIPEVGDTLKGDSPLGRDDHAFTRVGYE